MTTTSRDVKGIFNYRDRRYQDCCRFIASHRDTIFSNFTILELVYLGFHTSSRDAERISAIPQISELIREELAKTNFDEFKHYQLFCKAQDDLRLKTSINFEAAISFAAKSIVPADERERWNLHCRELLTSLKHSYSKPYENPTSIRVENALTLNDDSIGGSQGVQQSTADVTLALGDTSLSQAESRCQQSPDKQGLGKRLEQSPAETATGSGDALPPHSKKRRRLNADKQHSSLEEHAQHPVVRTTVDANDFLPSGVPRLIQNTNVLPQASGPLSFVSTGYPAMIPPPTKRLTGGFLWERLLSREKQQLIEETAAISNVTGVLHLPYLEGLDFVLQLEVSLVAGRHVERALQSSFEVFQSILGQTLYCGVRESHMYIEGGRCVAVETRDDQSGNCSIFLFLGFLTGQAMLAMIGN